MTAYNTISLFSGAMGLNLGIEKAGFKIRVCVEKDKWAAQTIRANTSIPVIERDINDVHTDEILAAAGIGRQDVTRHARHSRQRASKRDLPTSGAT